MNKALLRDHYLAQRKQLSSDEIKHKSQTIADNLLLHFSWSAMKSVHIFLPQRNSHEVDTWQIMATLQQSFPHLKIVVPCVIPGTRLMNHFIFNPQTVLIENRWGIPEPDPLQSQKVHVHSLDAVLIPLLTFDLRGYRVGYGGGYYDRFLSECRKDTQKIGVSFFEPVAEIEDPTPFDIRMDFCVTPTETFKWTF